MRLFGLCLLLRVVPLCSVVLCWSFLAAAFYFIFAVDIEEVVVVDGWSEYLLGLALEYPVTEFLLLQFHQLLDLFL